MDKLRSNKALIWLTLLTGLFSIIIAFDLLPILRGPAPYPPEWQWPYLYVNTFEKIYFPILILALILFLLFKTEKTSNLLTKHSLLVLITLILLSFIFQISVQFFSRAGTAVLIHRIINPELNGYFTASLPIQNAGIFITYYNNNFLNFVYHAASHPPGAILFFYFIKLFISLFPVLGNIASGFIPNHSDVRIIWDTLLPAEKATALFSGFFIPFLSALSIFPLFYSAKMIYGVKTAIRSVFVFIFIPSLVLFIPINDSFLHIFAITAFYFLLKGLYEKKFYYLSLSGFIIFLGIFFNLSIIPVLIFFGLYYIFINFVKYKNALSELIKSGLAFSAGLVLLPIFFYFILRFDFIMMIRKIGETVTHLHSRSYVTWILYNPVDFFIFSGIPLSIIFFLAIKGEFLNILKRKWKAADYALLSFLIMLVFINFSGSVRGETGRILSIIMPFMAMTGAAFTTKNLKFTTLHFGIFILLQAIQILVMQEFWVMLW